MPYNFNLENQEFIGATVLDTVGICIPSVDDALLEKMKLSGTDCPYRSLGLLSSRTGAAGQLCAVDDAIKSSMARLVSFDLPRDTKGWGGHGCYIVIGGDDVSDVKNAIARSLELAERNAGEVYINSAGHLEFAYSPSAGEVLAAAFDIPLGSAFGFIAGSPAAIGMLMADTAAKAADINITKYFTPGFGTSHSNEIIIAFSGQTDAVKTAVLAAREKGLEILENMGGEAKGPSSPYLR